MRLHRTRGARYPWPSEGAEDDRPWLLSGQSFWIGGAASVALWILFALWVILHFELA